MKRISNGAKLPRLLMPDYHKPVREVLRDAVRQAIFEEGDLNMILLMRDPANEVFGTYELVEMIILEVFHASRDQPRHDDLKACARVSSFIRNVIVDSKVLAELVLDGETAPPGHRVVFQRCRRGKIYVLSEPMDLIKALHTTRYASSAEASPVHTVPVVYNSDVLSIKLGRQKAPWHEVQAIMSPHPRECSISVEQALGLMLFGEVRTRNNFNRFSFNVDARLEAYSGVFLTEPPVASVAIRILNPQVTRPRPLGRRLATHLRLTVSNKDGVRVRDIVAEVAKHGEQVVTTHLGEGKLQKNNWEGITVLDSRAIVLGQRLWDFAMQEVVIGYTYV
ncbi:hypothetical protein Slin15195_G041580 [Septoria linicola]|uniref:Uncharacterized protein n=1 Tax=Septoria linicola TaxID=215465 RepID=A0A9Q9AK71_9PEZI|nr:hypothetical protein Slin14017_G045100 [Septoria linicola]USW50839.1 hypothetical protein Slin15195_G041580 [Septoria linicola]